MNPKEDIGIMPDNHVLNKGLGDTVSHVIKKVSGGRIKECGGCSKRRDWLNDKFRYKALDAIDKIQNRSVR